MDSDDKKYYAFADTEVEEEPRPSSRLFPSSQPRSPYFSASGSEDETNVGNMAGQQPQPSQWALTPKPQKRVVHTFIGTPTGKAVKLHMHS